jgi:hypothetical protein
MFVVGPPPVLFRGSIRTITPQQQQQQQQQQQREPAMDQSLVLHHHHNHNNLTDLEKDDTGTPIYSSNSN